MGALCPTAPCMRTELDLLKCKSAQVLASQHPLKLHLLSQPIQAVSGRLRWSPRGAYCQSSCKETEPLAPQDCTHVPSQKSCTLPIEKPQKQRHRSAKHTNH